MKEAATTTQLQNLARAARRALSYVRNPPQPAENAAAKNLWESVSNLFGTACLVDEPARVACALALVSCALLCRQSDTRALPRHGQ